MSKNAQRENTEQENKIRTYLAILGIIGAIIASGIGAFLGATASHNYDVMKSDEEIKSVANIFYSDLSSMDYFLISINETIDEKLQDKNLPFYMTSCLYYPDNGLYYVYNSKISSFDYPIASILRYFIPI